MSAATSGMHLEGILHAGILLEEILHEGILLEEILHEGILLEEILHEGIPPPRRCLLLHPRCSSRSSMPAPVVPCTMLTTWRRAHPAIGARGGRRAGRSSCARSRRRSMVACMLVEPLDSPVWGVELQWELFAMELCSAELRFVHTSTLLAVCAGSVHGDV